MASIVERAKQNGIPKIAERYQTEHIRQLVSVCRELQREAGKESFFLPVSVVVDLFNLGDGGRMRASRWLNGLVLDGVLELVERGGPQGRRVSRFGYLGD